MYGLEKHLQTVHEQRESLRKQLCHQQLCRQLLRQRATRRLLHHNVARSVGLYLENLGLKLQRYASAS